MAHNGFVIEFNNPKKYGLALWTSLEKAGLNARKIRHKTAFVIRFAKIRKLVDLQRVLTGLVDPRRGGLILLSKQTGNAWQLDNRGNRPGTFVRI